METSRDAVYLSVSHRLVKIRPLMDGNDDINGTLTIDEVKLKSDH